MTPRCGGCRARAAGIPAKRCHNEVCRKRIEEAVAADPERRSKLETVNARMERRMAADLEKARRKKLNKDEKHHYMMKA